ncbi:MAG: hypothetical protein LAP38_24190 [Acidobacteriia bacterium]|nr:hypothetical protein [Terriglobia bacterium]
MFTRILMATIALSSAVALAADNTPTGVPAHMVVTVAHHHVGAPQTFTPNDLIVMTGKYEPLQVTNFIPLEGDRAGLELFLLVDDCSNCEFGPKFDELRRFVSLQAATTAIGVAYIRNGSLEVLENPTKDRARAIQALTTPSGSKAANPFAALTDLIQRWPQNSSRHAVLMIANGIDPAANDAVPDISAERAIDAAERAGVIVYAIYHPSADYQSSDYSEIHSGQVHLAHVAYETGGEAYFIGPEPLRSLAPFLSDIGDHLVNQYLVEFLAQPQEASGFQSVVVKSKIANVELMAPDKVWVPARAQAPVSPRRER